MRNKLFLICLPILLLLHISCNGVHLSNDSVLIKNVNIVNPTDGSITTAQTILIENGNISRIIPAGAIAYAAHQEIKADGLYALPGIVDFNPELSLGNLSESEISDTLLAILKNGITTLFLNRKNLNPEFDKNQAIGPDIVSFISVALGKKNNGDADYSVTNPGEISALLGRLASLQPDIVFVTRDANNDALFNEFNRLAADSGQRLSTEIPIHVHPGLFADIIEPSAGVLKKLFAYNFLSENPGYSAKSLENGSKADIILLEKNPLTDIGNLKSVKTVIRGGQVISFGDTE